MATVFNGNELSQNILSLLKQEIEDSGLKPHLAILLVGENPASKIYVEKKMNAAQEIGASAEVLEFGEDVSERELIRQIKTLNDAKEVKGITVQLPLPKSISEKSVLASIAPQKDIDGLTALSPYKGATPLAVMQILKENNISLKGKHAVVVGRSNLVGKPLALLLLEADATVTIAHSKTKDLATFTKQADVLVSAVGTPRLIKADMVKEGVVVIDVGISRQKDKLLGDVDFEEVSKVASFITPVPGGVGPMTVVVLLSNLVEASKK